MYDFDKTLCAKDMQEYSFIPSVGMNAEAFWKESNEISEKNNMDRILSYMFLMIKDLFRICFFGGKKHFL